MLFDTDVLVWVLRGNKKAADRLDSTPTRYCSAVTYMELLSGVRNKEEQRIMLQFLRDAGFSIVSISEEISHRAMVYMEQFALSAGLELADALIAASAAENNLSICTANDKHYKRIPGLALVRFRP